jgi:aminoglycoside phosphotransferase (APT) family kinase protein
VDDATEAVLRAVRRTLGGNVVGLRRLSGGASRVTSAFELERVDGTRRPLILQVDRGGGISKGTGVETEAQLLRAAHAAGVPVPDVVGAGALSGGDRGWLVVDRLDGETIPRRILRDPEWAAARAALTAQCGAALAAIHRIDPVTIDGLPPSDPLRNFRSFLDALGEARPVLELGVRWLEAHRVRSSRRATTVHGDFRMGNFLVGRHGLRAVLDWELAHVGDPAEDLGWLCARCWRFGGPGRVGGFGALPDLLEAYAAAGGAPIAEAEVVWWEAYAAVKWAVICGLQAATHLSGAVRSVELAAIGRRICESEWDLLVLLDVASCDPTDATPAGDADLRSNVAPFGRPTAVELVEAVREHLDEGRSGGPSDERVRHQGRIASNVLHIVERELQLGQAIAAAHADRLTRLGFDDDASLAAAIRSGSFDGSLEDLGARLAASIRDELLVANPSYMADPGAAAARHDES